MKQKIVLKINMTFDKCRTKALEVASSADGIISLEITGADKDQLEVVGDGVDSSELVSCLRKKVGYTKIISIAEVKDEKKDDKKDEKDEEDENTCTITYPCPPPYCPPPYCPPPYCPPPYCPPPYPYCNNKLLYCYDEPLPTNNCSIM